MYRERRRVLLGAVTAAVLAGGLFVASPANAASTATIVAGPTGSGESCSVQAPCTLETAKVRARAASDAGDAVEVLLRGGQYNLPAALEFTSEDSGTAEAPVTFKAYSGEVPVLTSAGAIGGWVDDGAGVYSASITGRDFRQLYVNGVRATPARYPNVGSNVQLQSSDRNAKTLTILTEQFAAFGDADLTQVDLVAQFQWGETYARLASAADGGSAAIGALTKLSLQAEEADILFQRPFPLLSNGSPLHFENARAFLDAPGEFFVDRKADRVYYKPRPGETLSSDFTAPVLDTLVDIEGTSTAPVTDLRFEGLTFEYTGWNRPTEHGYLNAQGGQYNLSANLQNQQYSDRPPAAVQASYADRIAVTGNTFRRIGSTALDLDTAVHDSTVTGNVITDVSGNGIMVGKFTDADVEYHTPYKPADPNEVTARVTIANNLITRTGQVYLGTAGVNGGFIRDSSIVHNDISDSPWAGISTGWGWTREKTAQENNRISFNRISNVVNQLCDTAGIYHLSNDPGTIFEGNYIHDVVRTPTACGSAVNGIYLDEGTDNTIVRNNVLADVAGQFALNANGPNNTFENNVAENVDVIKAAGLEPAYRGLLNRVNIAAGKPSNSSSEYNSANRAGLALDGDLGTGWSPTSADSSAWWQVDLGGSVPLAQISLTTRQDLNQQETRRNFEVRGSNDADFSSYTVLAKRNDNTVANAGTYTSAITDNGTYRYLRVVKTDGSYFYITEFSAQAGDGVVSTPAVPEFDQSTPWILTNVNSGLVAEIAGRSTADGGELNQYTPNGQTNQQWYLRPAGGNLFTIVNVNSGKVLDNFESFGRGDRIRQWGANGKSNQLWTIERVGENFLVRNALSKQVLDIGGNSTTPGALVSQWMDLNQKNQQWKITPVNPVAITPSTTPTANAAGWHNAPVDVTFATPAAGVTVQSRLVGTESWVDAQPVRVTNQGSTKLDYRGLRSGSVAAGSQGQLEIKLDSVVPVSSAVSDPVSGTVPAGQTITARFTAADAGSGVAYIEHSIDNGSTWIRSTDAGVSFTASGAHVVQYRAVDAAGNVEQAKSITVTVAAPENVAKATITSADEPTADGWYQQSVLVKLTAPSATQKVQYRINGGAWKSYSTSITVSSSGTTAIDHRLLSGNVVIAGSDAQLQVKVDKTLPTVTAQRTPSSGQGTPRNPITVAFSGVDSLSGVDRIEYRVNSGAWTAATMMPVVFDAVGDYVVSYRATDRAGNVSTSKSATFTIVANAATTVKASAKTVKPGAAVTLTLAGFSRWDDLAVTFAGAPLATVLTDQNGTARVTLKIPVDALNGPAEIVATGTDGTTTATASVTVKN